MYLCEICGAGTPDTHPQWCIDNREHIWSLLAEARAKGYEQGYTQGRKDGLYEPFIKGTGAA